ELPAIRISESTNVVVQEIRIADAVRGIETTQASCQLVGCSFQTTDVAIRAIAFGSDVVRIQQGTFTGEADVGVLTLGDGTIEIDDCKFLKLGAGALLGGLTSVSITASTFEDCFHSIVLASSVAATLVGNHIDGSLWHGISVSSGFTGDYEDGSLVMNSNTIQNTMGCGISLSDYPGADAPTFTGRLSGTGNMIEGGRDLLCPVDYEWPEGFFADE
ncbi:MAG: right-handed parallel beta-helix repeat-containing protein, partial [Dehalococcoidia bacterium]|nr:right-handed parallel beta-helix repeat-containing protein [Dehalococcoidia bacterium]